MRATWRDEIRPQVAEAIERVGTADMKALRRALREAYPYGDVSWPRKIWNDEVNRQLGLKAERARTKRAAEDAARGQRFLDMGAL